MSSAQKFYAWLGVAGFVILFIGLIVTNISQNYALADIQQELSALEIGERIVTTTITEIVEVEVKTERVINNVTERVVFTNDPEEKCGPAVVIAISPFLVEQQQNGWPWLWNSEFQMTAMQCFTGGRTELHGVVDWDLIPAPGPLDIGGEDE
jgi:hypothetical protein